MLIVRQKRKDRKYKDPIRVFKTLDSAVNQIRAIGFKGMIIINQKNNDTDVFTQFLGLMVEMDSNDPEQLKAHFLKLKSTNNFG